MLCLGLCFWLPSKFMSSKTKNMAKEIEFNQPNCSQGSQIRIGFHMNQFCPSVNTVWWVRGFVLFCSSPGYVLTHRVLQMSCKIAFHWRPWDDWSFHVNRQKKQRCGWHSPHWIVFFSRYEMFSWAYLGICSCLVIFGTFFWETSIRLIQEGYPK